MKTGFPPPVRRLILERAGIEGDWVRCEIDGMWMPAADVQVHHRIGRGMGSSRRPELNQAANGLSLCPRHHEYCEMHRIEALENGWCISKLTADVPSEVAVVLRYGTVLLDDSGGYEVVEKAA